MGICRSRDREPARLVFVSTGSVYGTPEAQPISESAGLAPLNPYGASKVAAEQVMLGCGSSEILKAVAAAFTGRERKLVLAAPTFEAIGFNARVTGAEIVNVPLDASYAAGPGHFQVRQVRQVRQSRS